MPTINGKEADNMPHSELRLIKNALEYLPKSEIKKVPKKTRGIYVLYHQRRPMIGQRKRFDVVYVGMARRGIAGRLQTHIKSKGDMFTHFSFFEVWNNISDAEIVELEGLFRHLYRFDANANKLNKAKGYKMLGNVRRRTEHSDWLCVL
jgi:hypothetical protein